MFIYLTTNEIQKNKHTHIDGANTFLLF